MRASSTEAKGTSGQHFVMALLQELGWAAL